MSLHTFLLEFYPTDAQDCTTDLEAVRHSKQKWAGRLPENLARHEVKITTRYGKDIIGIYSKPETPFINLYSTDHCALCIRRQAYVAEQAFIDCTTCPITLATGYTCDDIGYGIDPSDIDNDDDDEYPFTPDSLYQLALKDPRVMLDALDEAEAYLLAQHFKFLDN